VLIISRNARPNRPTSRVYESGGRFHWVCQDGCTRSQNEWYASFSKRFSVSDRITKNPLIDLRRARRRRHRSRLPNSSLPVSLQGTAVTVVQVPRAGFLEHDSNHHLSTIRPRAPYFTPHMQPGRVGAWQEQLAAFECASTMPSGRKLRLTVARRSPARNVLSTPRPISCLDGDAHRHLFLLPAFSNSTSLPVTPFDAYASVIRPSAVLS
jgi:hypothetical protein